MTGTRGEVGGVRYKRSHVADARHDARHHTPAECGSVQGTGLANYGTNSVRLHDAPDEEGDTGNGDDDCLQRKQVATMHVV